jgi:hypothetical protein
MADTKKSFILYCDLLHTFNSLTDEEAGKLIKHVLSYVNDLNPQTEDRIIKIAFEPIKQQLKRDLKHWESIKEKRSEAGKASAESRKHKSTCVDFVEENEQVLTNSTVNDNVTVSVTVNDNTLHNKLNNTEILKNEKNIQKPENDYSPGENVFTKRVGSIGSQINRNR